MLITLILTISLTERIKTSPAVAGLVLLSALNDRLGTELVDHMICQFVHLVDANYAQSNDAKKAQPLNRGLNFVFDEQPRHNGDESYHRSG